MASFPHGGRSNADGIEFVGDLPDFLRKVAHLAIPRALSRSPYASSLSAMPVIESIPSAAQAMPYSPPNLMLIRWIQTRKTG
jgi:hypothetical protein